MKYYIDTTNQVYAFEADGSQDEFISETLKPISIEAVEAIRNAQVNSPEQVATLERSWRGSELTIADVQLLKVEDSDPTAIGTVDSWRKYRVELRGWPEDKNFPDNSFRPIRPT